MRSIRYRRKSDIILNYGAQYQIRLRKFGGEMRGQVFTNQAWNRMVGKIAWRRSRFSITIKDGMVTGMPRGSFIELYVIRAFNKAYPHIKIRSDYWSEDA